MSYKEMETRCIVDAFSSFLISYRSAAAALRSLDYSTAEIDRLLLVEPAKNKMKIEFTTKKRESFLGGWARNCRIDGVEFCLSVRRGKSVRIPYKPRGKNRGWKWNGCVYSNGKCLWDGDVPGSIGVRGLLIRAGVFDDDQS